MLDFAINGFEAEDVQAAMLGASGVIKRRYRFEQLDKFGVKLRNITSVKEGGGIKYAESNPIVRRGGDIAIEERNYTLVDDYFDPFDDSNVDLEMPTLYSQITHESAIAFWRFGETSGTSAVDATGNGHTGTYQNGVGLNSRSLCEAALLNGSASFDGSNDYVSVPDSAAWDVANISIEFWIQTSSVVAGQRIIERDDAANASWVVLMVSGELRFRIFIGGVAKLLSTGVLINDGIPHHIVCTYDGAFMKAYVDGSRVGTPLAQTGNIDTGASTINIGGSPGTGAYTTGLLDEVAIYGYALSNAQVRARFQAGSGLLHEVDFLNDQIAVYCAIKMPTAGDDGTPWSEFPRGRFSLIYPDVDEESTGSTFNGLIQDNVAKLEKAKVRLANYTMSTADKYREVLEDLFTYAGFTASQYAIAISTISEATLPASKEYKIGTSVLTMMNEVLKEMNYWPARADSYGLVRLDEWTSSGDRATELTLSADENSIIRTSLKKSTNLKDVYNDIYLKKPGSKGVQELIGTAQITKASHPLSVGRAGYITYSDENVVAGSQDVIDAMALKIREEKGRVAYDLELATPLLCVLDNEDLLRLVGVKPPPLLAGAFLTFPDKFLVTEYSEPFDDTADCTMKCAFFLEAA